MGLTQEVNFVVIIPEYSPVDKFWNEKRKRKKNPRNRDLSIPFSFYPFQPISFKMSENLFFLH